MRNRSILITGCASGIGHHAAHALSARGWRVFATCRKEEDCARLREEGLESLRLDYQDTSSIHATWDEIALRSGGGPDALFNNGAFALPGAIEDIPTDAFRDLFEANFFGWHELTRLVVPAMRTRGTGRIVQCSSVLGFTALRFRGPYIASKHALEGYTDVLRLELRRTPIHVILLEPGPIGTRLRVNSQPHYERWVEKKRTPWANFYKTTLEKRLYAVDPPPDFLELTPEATTAKLIRALESRRPRPRYYVTTPTYMVAGLKRLLPTRWLDSIMVRG